MTPWDFPAPHVVTLEVLAADIDAYDHVNNSVYLAWLDRAAWCNTGSIYLRGAGETAAGPDFARKFGASGRAAAQCN